MKFKIPEFEIEDDRLKEISACGLWFILGAISVFCFLIPQYREDLFNARVNQRMMVNVMSQQQNSLQECATKLQQTYVWLGLSHEGESSWPATGERP